MITPVDFRTRYPEFADVVTYPDARIEMFIADAIDDMGDVVSHWQSEYRYNRALSALSAHYLALGEDSEFGDTNAKYPIIQKTAGGVSLSYAGVGSSHKTEYMKRLSSTTYGQEFLSIRGRSFVGSLVVTQDGDGLGGV